MSNATTNADAIRASLGLTLLYTHPTSRVGAHGLIHGTVATEHHPNTCTICAELADRAPVFAAVDRKKAATCAVVTDGGVHGARWMFTEHSNEVPA